jgi:hypothetical protein
MKKKSCSMTGKMPKGHPPAATDHAEQNEKMSYHMGMKKKKKGKSK